MEAVLESREWASIEAGDRVQAIEMRTAEMPSVVLFGMRMPKMNGMETLQELKKLDSDQGWLMH